MTQESCLAVVAVPFCLSTEGRQCTQDGLRFLRSCVVAAHKSQLLPVMHRIDTQYFLKSRTVRKVTEYHALL